MGRVILALAVSVACLVLVPAAQAQSRPQRGHDGGPLGSALAGRSRGPASLVPGAPLQRLQPPGLLLPRSGALLATSVQSANWAGYDVTGPAFTFSSVTASWVQPAIAASSDDTYAAFWVGLDGAGSSTVEQTGTVAESSNGTVSYYAWYEMYPASMRSVDLTVSPGDQMTASVTSDGAGDFALTITDETTGDSFTRDRFSAAAQCASAEVIAEAPTDTSTGDLLPLAAFGTMDFSSCAFNGQPISAFDWDQVDMVAQGGSTLIATSPLASDGASFSLTSYPGVAEAPTLSGFTPTSGPVGTLVTISGTGFTAASAVSFNGVPASFTVQSDGQITATVPSGAANGPITVSTPSGSVTSTAGFTVTATPALTLTPRLTLGLSGITNAALVLGNALTATGTVTPANLGGSVTLTVQREQAGKWLAVTHIVRAFSAGGTFKATFKPTRQSSYRIKASVAQSATHTAAKTTWRTFSVI